MCDICYPHARELLGERVKVTLHQDLAGIVTSERGKTVVEGKLVGFGEGGNFEIIEDDGFMHYCWPMLHIERA